MVAHTVNMGAPGNADQLIKPGDRHQQSALPFWNKYKLLSRRTVHFFTNPLRDGSLELGRQVGTGIHGMALGVAAKLTRMQCSESGPGNFNGTDFLRATQNLLRSIGNLWSKLTGSLSDLPAYVRVNSNRHNFVPSHYSAVTRKFTS